MSGNRKNDEAVTFSPLWGKKAFKNHNMGESGAPITPPVHREEQWWSDRGGWRSGGTGREEDKRKNKEMWIENERKGWEIRPADNEKRLPDGGAIQETGSWPNSIRTQKVCGMKGWENERGQEGWCNRISTLPVAVSRSLLMINSSRDDGERNGQKNK